MIWLGWVRLGIGQVRSGWLGLVWLGQAENSRRPKIRLCNKQAENSRRPKIRVGRKFSRPKIRQAENSYCMKYYQSALCKHGNSGQEFLWSGIVVVRNCLVRNCRGQELSGQELSGQELSWSGIVVVRNCLVRNCRSGIVGQELSGQE